MFKLNHINTDATRIKNESYSHSALIEEVCLHTLTINSSIKKYEIMKPNKMIGKFDISRGGNKEDYYIEIRNIISLSFIG